MPCVALVNSKFENFAIILRAVLEVIAVGKFLHAADLHLGVPLERLGKSIDPVVLTEGDQRLSGPLSQAALIAKFSTEPMQLKPSTHEQFTNLIEF